MLAIAAHPAPITQIDQVDTVGQNIHRRPSVVLANELGGHSTPQDVIEKLVSNELLDSTRRASAVLADLLSANAQAFAANELSKQTGARCQEGQPHICVVGVGYVGEILLREFGNVFPAIGFDISQKRLAEIENDFADLKEVRLTSDTSLLKEATHFCISVPTLLRDDRSVNADHLKRAIEMVTTHAQPGSTIVIESSVSVGMTRSLLGPYASKFHCGMSPERVDPGRTLPAAHDIPKIISALTKPAMERMNAVYSKAFRTVVRVSKPEVAEMTKLFENCYRMINIAYVNEVADACRKQDIDVYELVQAASTKPFGFQSFQPGLGVGGHCIPINPFYLMANNELPLLRQATENMWTRPAMQAREFLAECRRNSPAPRVLIVGMGFKPGQRVTDCSPSVAFAQELVELGCRDLQFYDPLVEQSQLPWIRRMSDADFKSHSIESEFDSVAVCMKQVDVDWTALSALTQTQVQWFVQK
ncbi:UDP-N-acetyl-D-mannosamine 6-dehydrogenase [Teratosphaeria destructans]|uniref:UDP-N-acetyl-D-mannosamine 6-dehydrogenase n=1 Tax=Teratosphaeria destructans TaxID=418781 RepID=A0A9W7SIQ6_9PEZI|nr:UDP-N-acetyl-D-mannosamine 6-dehydrogenase [Teratosphaeria destructans]